MTSNIFGRGFDSRRLHHYRVALALIFLLSVPCFSQQRGENGMYPLIGRDAADVRASFIALVGTLSVIPTIPVAGMALILGIDRVLSMFRATVNMVGNGVATLVLARWDGELDHETLQQRLARPA